MIKSPRPLRIPALILFIIAVAALAAIALQGRFRLSGLLPGFLRPRRISSSWSVLQEIRSIQELETASYHMKVVFPFDFIREDSVDWTYLKLQYDRDPNLFMAKTDPAAHPGGRLPPEWKHAELYHISRSVGIDPGRPDYRFVVLSAVFTAGVDLEAWLAMFTSTAPPEDKNQNESREENPGETQSEPRGTAQGKTRGGGSLQGSLQGIRIQENPNGGRTLELIPPPVGLTAFFIEDKDTSREGFPDVPLSPERFRILSDALLPQLRQTALESGLVEMAREGALSFLVEIFTAAGYQDVRFSPS